MRSFFIILSTVVLTGIVITLGALLLPACSLHFSITSTILGWCPNPHQHQDDQTRASVWDKNRELKRLVLERERELAALQCQRQHTSISNPPLNNIATLTPSLEPINRNEWEARDVNLLDGCWSLDSFFSTINRQTGHRSNYDQWQMCFDHRGVGIEEMTSNTGSTCKGDIRAFFGADGVLQIEQPKDLACSDGATIFQMVSRCSLEDNGKVNCTISQSATGASTSATFRRANQSN